MEDYRKLKRVNNSGLTLLRQCPELYKRREIDEILDDRQETEAMALGSLVHCLLLEPEKVDERYAVAPICDRRTKEGKAIWADFSERMNGQTVLKQETFDEAVCIAAGLFCNETASQLLSAKAYKELTLTFDWDGTPCKSRLDYLSANAGIIFDIKTTQNAHPDEFAKSVASFGYHRQASFYREAVKACYGTEPRFLFGVVSTQYPYLAAVHELDEHALGVGKLEVEILLDELKYRTMANDWRSSFTNGINVISLTKWYV
jgi:exodeoxyribonuclease VIII